MNLNLKSTRVLLHFYCPYKAGVKKRIRNRYPSSVINYETVVRSTPATKSRNVLRNLRSLREVETRVLRQRCFAGVIRFRCCALIRFVRFVGAFYTRHWRRKGENIGLDDVFQIKCGHTTNCFRPNRATRDSVPTLWGTKYHVNFFLFHPINGDVFCLLTSPRRGVPEQV